MFFFKRFIVNFVMAWKTVHFAACGYFSVFPMVLLSMKFILECNGNGLHENGKLVWSVRQSKLKPNVPFLRQLTFHLISGFNTHHFLLMSPDLLQLSWFTHDMLQEWVGINSHKIGHH